MLPISRRVKIIAGLLLGLMCLVVFWVVAPYALFIVSVSGRSSVKELLRIPSQDKVVEAVLLEDRPSFSIEPISLRVFIILAGEGSIDATPVLEGTGLKDLKITWFGPRVLQLSYSSGCVDSFRNRWIALKQDGHPFEPNGQPYIVEVRLKGPEGAASQTCY
jgi:hypothetical protein